jgi:hypothetical protein
MATSKLDTDAFLYLNPDGDEDYFAQCSTCRDWVKGDELCAIHGPYIEVPGTASCGLYVIGEPHPPGTMTQSLVTPTESGLVDREVRCENCRWGGPNNYTCGLYETLNSEMGEIFDLNTDIDPKGCCNANEPREREA